MTIPRSIARMAVTLGAIVALGPGLGCDCNCDAPYPMESGDYVIASPTYDNIHAGDEGFLGGELHVDREAHLATLRYTREGTTYEVRYTLQP